MSDPAARTISQTPIVFDTDMATDCDDAAALAVLHALASRGEARILATVINNRGAYSAGVVAAINAFYNRPDVPIGAYQGDAIGTETAPFFEAIARDTDTYGHAVTTREDVPDAVAVYRKALAAADADDIVVVSVGHLNNLSALLDSGPDEYSDLDGHALVERAVERLVVMGGQYPSGKEHNFVARGADRITGSVMERWPTPILFSGYELGAEILTGPALAALAASHPVRRAYAGHPSEPLVDGRPSWDQTAVLAAVRDPERYWGLGPPGTVRVNADGSNEWSRDPDGPHEYLLERAGFGPAAAAAVIEGLMVEPPSAP